MPGYGIANLVGQRADMGLVEKRRTIEQRECALFGSQLDRCAISGMIELGEPGIDQRDAFRRAVTGSAEDERVSETRDA